VAQTFYEWQELNVCQKEAQQKRFVQFVVSNHKVHVLHPFGGARFKHFAKAFCSSVLLKHSASYYELAFLSIFWWIQ